MKKDEKRKMEQVHQQKGKSDDQECGRPCWTFAQHHEAHSIERWSTDLEEEEDAMLLDRCEAKMKEWAKHWQCDEEVQNVEVKGV